VNASMPVQGLASRLAWIDELQGYKQRRYLPQHKSDRALVNVASPMEIQAR
jgi:hypothetical protein